MTPGQLVKKYREKSKLSQLHLANKLGYKIPQFISLMENGHSKVPREKCLKLVKILNIPLETLRKSFIKEELAEIDKAFGIKKR